MNREQEHGNDSEPSGFCGNIGPHRDLFALAAVPFGASALLAGSPSNRVVVALIGPGGRGMDVIRKMVQVPDVQVKYVCDVEDARGKSAVAELAKLQGAAPQHVVDLRTVLDDKEVQGVVVATPEQWHALATIWACQAGKDVYVEKNISLSVWEGRKMIEAARKHQRVVQAGFQNRMHRTRFRRGITSRAAAWAKCCT